MRQVIRLKESEFRVMIDNIVNEALQDEGFWNNIKAGAKTFMSNGNKGQGLSGRYQNAKKNFKLQGQVDNMDNLIKQLTQYVEAGQIDPNVTVQQLLGKGKQFGKMVGKMNNFRSQMTKNGMPKKNQK